MGGDVSSSAGATSDTTIAGGQVDIVSGSGETSSGTMHVHTGDSKANGVSGAMTLADRDVASLACQAAFTLDTGTATGWRLQVSVDRRRPAVPPVALAALSA